MPQENELLIEDARIVFRNFEGREGQYNREGDRNFSVVLDEEMADRLEKDGWNVKRKPPREEGDDPFNHLAVSVSFKGRPPRLVMVTSRGRTVLDEESCVLLDWADIKTVDVVIRPYSWAVNGKTGVKAYLKTIYVTIHEDPLDMKYQDLPELNGAPALPAGEDNDIIDGEIVGEFEDGEEPKALPRGKS